MAEQREGVIRIEDSSFLRQFTPIFNDPMIDITSFCHLRSRIAPRTWEQVNDLLRRAAVAGGRVTGQCVRLDTTAVETDIHWPTDSTLLLASQTTLARLLERLRKLDPAVVGRKWLQIRQVRRLQPRIARRARARSAAAESPQPLYLKLIRIVHPLCRWCDEVLAAVAVQRTRSG